MRRLFVSQPMRDKTDEEILAVREHAIAATKQHIGEDIELLDSFFQGVLHEGNKGLYLLGKSLELMSVADVVYFARGWDNYRGCKIEHEAAIAYGLEIIHEVD